MSHSAGKVWDPAPAVLRDRLWRHVEDGASLGVYALLDGDHPVASHHALHPDKLAARVPAANLMPIPRPGRPSMPETWPQLLLLRTPESHGWLDEELLGSTLADAVNRCASINGAYVCGWFVAAGPPDDLARRIGKSMHWHTPATKRFVLPWFEPYRWSLLAGSPVFLSRLQKNIPGLRCWFWVDGSGQLSELPLGAGTGDDPVANQCVIHISDWERQQRVRLGRQVLLALDKADVVLENGVENMIDEALKAADAQGLSRHEDKLCFAVQCVLMGQYWYRAHEAQRCIKRAAKQEVSLADALDALDDQTLEMMMGKAVEPTLQEQHS